MHASIWRSVVGSRLLRFLFATSSPARPSAPLSTHLSDPGESGPEYERDDERDDEGDVVEEVVDARLDGAVGQVEVHVQRRRHGRRHRPQLRFVRWGRISFSNPTSIHKFSCSLLLCTVLYCTVQGTRKKYVFFC